MNKSKLEVFEEKTEDMVMKKASLKVMKCGEYKELDEALYIWFRQQRELALQQRRQLLSNNSCLLHIYNKNNNIKRKDNYYNS